MVLHLVRHAEAGSGELVDPGLTPRGVEQSGQLAGHLADLGIELVVHGPARRARETAELVSSTLGTLPPEQSDLARDRTPFPDADDLSYSVHARAWLDSSPLDERDPGARALSADCATLLALSDERSVLVVTHAFVVAWCVAHALGAPDDAWLRLPVDNASVTTLDRNRHGE